MKSNIKIGDIVKYDVRYKQVYGIVVARPSRQVTIQWLSRLTSLDNTQTYSLNSNIMADIEIVSR